MTFSKKDVTAWNIEYSHLKWGGLSETAWIWKYLETNDCLLDAGSGEGRYLREFCSKCSCIGIDVSENALQRSLQQIEAVAEKQMKKQSNSESPTIIIPDHFVSSIFALPFADSVFDGILCLGVLQHLTEENRKKTVDEFFRVLKKGGHLFFEAFGESDMRCQGEAYPLENPESRTFLRQNGIVYHYFEESEIRSLFESSGFSVLELKSLKKEKKYDGNVYIRHHYRAVLKK